MKSFLLFYLLFLAISVSATHIRPVMVDHDRSSSYDLKDNLFYYIDNNQILDIPILIKNNFSDFKPLKSGALSTGFGEMDVWFVFKIDNHSGQGFDVILNTGNSDAKHIDFYLISDSVILRDDHFGTSYSFFNRDISYRNFVLKIFLEPQKTYTCVLRTNNNGISSNFNFSLQPAYMFASNLFGINILDGLFYGIILYVFIVNLLLYFVTKERIYLFLSIFSFFLGIFQSAKDGYAFQYFWPDFPWFNSVADLFFACIAFFTLIVFAKIFLHTRFNSPKMDVGLNISLITLLMLSVLSFFIPGTIIIRGLIGATGLISITACFFASLEALKKNYKQSVFLVISFLLALLAIVFYLTKSYGFLPPVVMDFPMLKLCFILQIALFSFALTYRVKKMMEDTEYVRKNLEKANKEHNTEIEAQNEELHTQTEELLAQKEELQVQSEELLNQREVLIATNAELEKLHIVTSKTNNLIYIFDAAGFLSWFNDSFSSMLGYSFAEFKRANLKINIRDISFNSDISSMVDQCISSKVVVVYESFFVDSKGNSFWFQTTLTPIVDENGEVKNLVAIDTDITKLKLIESELNKQKGEYEMQRNYALLQKDNLEHQQKEITDSIRYAKRIQSAILPHQKVIYKFWPESFVLLMPKDIVSGDFYWYYRLGSKHFVIGVDCTGHGVPGAFMSIIGTYLLNAIIIQNGVTKPSEILKQLNRKVKISLNSENVRMQTNDGMDIAICVIDRENDTLEFASAMRSVYFFNNNEFIELHGDKIPISSDISGNIATTFNDQLYKLYPGDTFYLFSDGIIDQFGGKHNKKFLSKRFKQLLVDNQMFSMKEQKDAIQKAIEDWKGNHEQVDDIMVIGIKYI